MKKFITGIIILAGSTLITLSSCRKSSSVVTPATTVSTINGDPTLTIFSAIENRSGDNSLVNSSAAMVIPVDSAFINAGITASIAATLNPETCDSIVKYYTFSMPVNFNDSSNKEIPFVSNLGASLYGDSSSAAQYFNGIASISMIPASTGVAPIYKLSQFIHVPEVSITQVLSADTSLTLFTEAYNRTNLASNLSTGSFTLFMPSNMAFANAGFPTIASIDSADINMLTKILMYHIVPNDYFENDLAKQTSLTTLQGETVQIMTSNGLQLLGTSDGTSLANLANTGILAANVLTYKISTVLLP